MCIRDSHRLAGLVVEITEHDNRQFYKVGVVGGVLNTSFVRQDLVHEAKQSPSSLGLQGVGEGNWRSLPKISIRQGVKNVSLTGGQGMVKCSCKKATCKTNKCACYRANRKCNSRCHAKNANCKNHDQDDVMDIDDDGEDNAEDSDVDQPTKRIRQNDDDNMASDDE